MSRKCSSNPAPTDTMSAAAAADSAAEGACTTIVGIVPAKRTAFEELMSPSKRSTRIAHNENVKTAQPLPISELTTRDVTFHGRDGLGAYLAAPEQFPSTRVLYFNNDFVVIHDLYPKSAVHLLILPRHQLTKCHPIDAFDQDSDLLEACKGEVSRVKSLVASELRRMFGSVSILEQERQLAVEKNESRKDATGRDWESEVIAGVHSAPSMNHLHIHVLSRERVSPCLKHRKHYQSFATPFLITLEEFPLAQADVRRQPGRGRFLERDMACWRCGRRFGNRFAELKRHLNDEFMQWKKI